MAKKMRKFTVYKNSESVKLVAAIIKTEDLDIQVSYTETTLGDSVIQLYGPTEDVNIFEEVYNFASSC